MYDMNSLQILVLWQNVKCLFTNLIRVIQSDWNGKSIPNVFSLVVYIPIVWGGHSVVVLPTEPFRAPCDGRYLVNLSAISIAAVPSIGLTGAVMCVATGAATVYFLMKHTFALSNISFVLESCNKSISSTISDLWIALWITDRWLMMNSIFTNRRFNSNND